MIDLSTMIDLPKGQESAFFEMVTNILIEMLGIIAEQEIRRQREAVNSAKSKVRHCGKLITNKPASWDEVSAL